MGHFSPESDMLDQLEDNELAAARVPLFIRYCAAIPISTADLADFARRNVNAANLAASGLPRLITAFNLGIETGHGLKDTLIAIGLAYQAAEDPDQHRQNHEPDYQLAYLPQIVMALAVAKIKSLL